MLHVYSPWILSKHFCHNHTTSICSIECIWTYWHIDSPSLCIQYTFYPPSKKFELLKFLQRTFIQQLNVRCKKVWAPFIMESVTSVRHCQDIFDLVLWISQPIIWHYSQFNVAWAESTLLKWSTFHVLVRKHLNHPASQHFYAMCG